MFERLERNIKDMIAEQQIKLGYLEESVQLYYPLESLNGLLGQEYTDIEMAGLLEKFFHAAKERFGEVEVTEKGGRFCLRLPPQAGKYVQEHIDDYAFLKELIQAVAGHGHTFEELLAIFRKYSDCVHVEPTSHGEFDYLVYFQDGLPDEFIYCISAEGDHLTYHRFTKTDFDSLNLAVH